ncbi:MAG: plastocyanin/azurin family copper-binding protein [Candidatus Thermoplasmatota archaeon]
MFLLFSLTLVAGQTSQEPDPGLRGPDQAPGQTFNHTFMQAGRFDYHCHPHPWMVAAVVVQNSTGRAPMTHTIRMVEPEGKDFDQWTFSPKSLAIEAGDTVTWLNAGGAIHVVQETVGEHIEHIGTAEGHDDVATGAHDEVGGDDHGASPAGQHVHGKSLFDSGTGWVLILVVGGLALAFFMKRKSA